jgi:hypothetical protein
MRIAAGLALCLLNLTGSCVAGQAPQPDEPAPKLPALLSAKPVKDEPTDDELRKHLKARYNEVLSEGTILYGRYNTGQSGSGRLVEAAKRLVQAGLELHDKQVEKVTLLTHYVELLKDVEKATQALHDMGRVTKLDLHWIRYQRQDAQIQLLRAKRVTTKANGK